MCERLPLKKGNCCKSSECKKLRFSNFLYIIVIYEISTFFLLVCFFVPPTGQQTIGVQKGGPSYSAAIYTMDIAYKIDIPL